ncbi:MAG: hypothetical protein ACXVII_37650 [Solirubrobacteraceae bacterium]
MQESALGRPVEGAAEQTTTSEDIDRLEEHLQGALDELRQERERRASAPEESGSSESSD